MKGFGEMFQINNLLMLKYIFHIVDIEGPTHTSVEHNSNGEKQDTVGISRAEFEYIFSFMIINIISNIIKVHVTCTVHIKSITKRPFTAMLNFQTSQAYLLQNTRTWYLQDWTNDIYRIVKGIWIFRKCYKCYTTLKTKTTKEPGLHKHAQTYTCHTTMNRLLLFGTMKSLRLVSIDFCICWSFWHDFCL